MKTLHQFLVEAVSKKSSLSIFKKKMMTHELQLIDLLKETLKEVFPHVHITSNEENENLLSHLVNASKNVRLIQPIQSKNFITKNEIVKSTKFTIAIDVEVEQGKCIVKHQFSIPNGKDFRDNEMTQLIESINRALGECLSFLTKVLINDVHFEDEHDGNDILYTITAEDIKTIKVDNNYHLLFYIPRSVKEIHGNVSFCNLKLTSLPFYIPDIIGIFDCSHNQLTSLKGCPSKVNFNFDCSHNQLTSLKYCPKELRQNFNCSNNQLKSLKFSPTHVNGAFYCNDNKLTSLVGSPTNISKNFDCSINQITSLKGVPEKIGGNFNCSLNQLTSIDEYPKLVGNDFICNDNKLTSLKGCPKQLDGDLNCSNNQLDSLDGIPERITGDVYIRSNKKKFTKQEVNNISDILGDIIV